jgi:phosphatidylglycerol:prolipoprotein diacylglycerol transferase
VSPNLWPGGPVEIPAYFTLLTIGFLCAMWLTVRDSKRLGMDHQRVLDTNLWMIVWGLIGSRLLHVVADGHFQEYVNLCVDPTLVKATEAKVEFCTQASQCGWEYLCNVATHTCYPPRDCLRVFKIWYGGFAYYGGFIAATAFAFYYVRKHKLGWWRTADLASPAIALGLVFGRIGCFFNGCCFGKRTDGHMGVVFPRFGSVWRHQIDEGQIARWSNALPVHPTQLYEAAGCLLVFLILYFVVRPRRKHFGDVFAWFLILYGIVRFVVEYWRDDDRGVFFGNLISTSQLISIPLVLGGIVLLVRRPGESSRPSPSPDGAR